MRHTTKKSLAMLGLDDNESSDLPEQYTDIYIPDELVIYKDPKKQSMLLNINKPRYISSAPTTSISKLSLHSKDTNFQMNDKDDLTVIISNSANDITEETGGSLNGAMDEIINDMKLQEIHELKTVLNAGDTKYDQETESTHFRMDWFKACNGINHEIFPKLSSAVRGIINGKAKEIDKYDLSQKCINKVIGILKEEQYLAIEEREYLRLFLQRASTFKPITNEFEQDLIKENPIAYQDHVQNKGMNGLVLMDIFDVHRMFVFCNFNMREYTIDNFKKDVTEKGKQSLGEKKK
eukprot:36857_1